MAAIKLGMAAPTDWPKMRATEWNRLYRWHRKNGIDVEMPEPRNPTETIIRTATTTAA